MAKNAARQSSIQRAEDRIKRDDDDLRTVMSTVAGRRLMWRLLGDTGLYRLSFHPSGSQTMFNEGGRNIGLMWQSRMIDVDHALFLTMQAEAKKLADDDALFEGNDEEERQ